MDGKTFFRRPQVFVLRDFVTRIFIWNEKIVNLTSKNITG